jgi:hypothetical protein
VTHAKGMWWLQSGLFLGLLWLIVTMTLEATRETGVPIAVAILIAWSLIIFSFSNSIRFRVRAQRQATEAVATWERANVPVRSVEAFDRWAAQSQYYKLRNELDRQEP